MGIRVASANFTKGEISPQVEARFDLDVYKAGLRKASNVVIRKTGGVRKRPGSRFVAMASGTRLIPFQFSDTQAYALEFGQGTMRPYALGGAVLETGLKVTAITKAGRAQITCANHGYSVGQFVWFDSVQGMVEINDRTAAGSAQFLQVESVIDANTFTVNFNSTNASTFTGDTGQVNAAPPSPPPAPPPIPAPTPTPAPPPVSSGSGGGGYTSGTGGQWQGGSLGGVSGGIGGRTQIP